MAPVIPLEPHELDTRTVFCPRCAEWTATTVTVGVVDGRDLRLLHTYESTTCACGYEELTR